MLSVKSLSSSFIATAIVAAAIAAFSISASAQEKGSQQMPYVDDWTHHHMVFSNPGTKEDAIRTKTLDHWQKVSGDPRFLLQQGKRQHSDRQVNANFDHHDGWDHSSDEGRRHRNGRNHDGKPLVGIEKDWNVVLGGGSSLISTVAAPSGSNISGSSTLTVDGVVFTASAPTAATQTGSFNGTKGDSLTPGGKITITNGANTLTITSASTGANGCTTSSAGTYVETNSNADATNLAAAITACNASFPAVGVTATAPVPPAVTVTAVNAGTGGNSITVALGTPALNKWSWNGANLTGGADGTANTTSFPYWSVNSYVSAAQLATNIATAVNSNATVGPLIKTLANSPTSGEITFLKLLTAGGPYSVATGGGFTGFSGTGSLTGGVQATVQPNALPAKFGASLAVADCTNDFVVYPSGQPGAVNTAATIVAYNNLYTGTCTGTVPSSYWAYNTGTGYSVTTSPVLPWSWQGNQVAFMQTNGTTAQLVILKWASGSTNSFASPAAITSETPATYPTCTAPCYVSIPFANGNNSSISSPYYDYTSADAIYVGDDSGFLHKFTGVFSGTPTEVTTGWPVQLRVSGAKISSPVFDLNSGNIFVGDTLGTLYSVTASSGALHASAALGDAIVDAPLVDGAAGSVYAFVTTSGTFNSVEQLSTGFTNSSTPIVAHVGTGGAGFNLYAGTFDNVYFQSTNPPTGNLWVVGNTGVATGATLYRVPILLNVLSTVPVAAVTALTPNAANAFPWPSPLTEYCNLGSGACAAAAGVTTGGSTDYIYFSVNRGSTTMGGTATLCTNSAGNGCIVGFNVTNPALPTLAGTQNYVTPGTNGCWATGGIVIDNSSASAGASQIYFVGLNGAAAGGPGGAGGQTTSNCTASSAQTINAIQAAQNNP